MVSVLIIDDNQTFADALQIAIDGDPELECVGIVHSADEAVEAVCATAPDHCLVNLDAGAKGFAAVRTLRELAPELAVTVLTGQTDAAALREAQEAGASHFVPKQSSIRDVLAALHAPHTGCMVVPGSVVVDLLGHRQSATAAGAVEGLTAREQEVLQGMAEGTAPKVIAAAMGISVHTVRGHVKNIYWKLDAHNQLEAVAIARRRGLIRAAG